MDGQCFKNYLQSFKWVKEDDLSKLNKSFIKNYDENSDKGYILEVNAKYPQNVLNLHKDLREKCEKLVCTIQNKKNYVIHINALKQVLNHGLILKMYIG